VNDNDYALAALPRRPKIRWPFAAATLVKHRTARRDFIAGQAPKRLKRLRLRKERGRAKKIPAYDGAQKPKNVFQIKFTFDGQNSNMDCALEIAIFVIVSSITVSRSNRINA
jgi:hypothetical protein